MIVASFPRDPTNLLMPEKTRKERTSSRRQRQESAGSKDVARDCNASCACIGESMKTARFSDVVSRSGRPNLHLAWSAPLSDKALQTAEKERRVLTVHQQTRGAKKDFGAVGLEAGKNVQFLIFPKSLRAFAHRRIIGIQYDLLEPEISSGGNLPRSVHTGRRASRSKRIVRFELPKGDGPTEKREESKPAPLPEPEDTDPVKREIHRAILDLKSGHTKRAQWRLEQLLK